MNSSKLLSAALIAISALAVNTASAQGVAITPINSANNAPVAGNRTWAPIAEKDITSKRRYWLEVDTKAEQNTKLLYNENGGALIDVIIQGVKEGKIVAYSSENDRFTKALTIDEFTNLIETTFLAARLTDRNGKEVVYRSGSSRFTPGSVVKFTVKQDLLNLKNSNAGVVRVLGIAPIVELVNKKGEAEEQPFFWIYYPDAMKYLGTVKANNTAETWADVIEDHQFTGKVVKEGKAK